MTIERVAERSGITVGEAPPGRDEGTTLAFALDHGYLAQLRALVASMIVAGTMLRSPVCVYSDDERVFEDPLVTLMADRKRLLREDERAVLHDVARDSVMRRSRFDWNRGTCLKWRVFEEHDTPQALFMDVDMICVRPIEELLDAAPESRILCVPQFRDDLRFDEGKRLKPADQILEGLDHMLAGRYHGRLVHRLNSGMMLVRGDLLSEDFFEELTRFALGHREVNEQALLSLYFKEHPGLLRMLPAGYNFQDSYLHGLDWNQQRRVLDRVRILHYAGVRKPWSTDPGAKFRPTMALWHWYRSLAASLPGGGGPGGA